MVRVRATYSSVAVDFRAGLSIDFAALKESPFIVARFRENFYQSLVMNGAINCQRFRRRNFLKSSSSYISLKEDIIFLDK